MLGVRIRRYGSLIAVIVLAASSLLRQFGQPEAAALVEGAGAAVGGQAPPGTAELISATTAAASAAYGLYRAIKKDFAAE